MEMLYVLPFVAGFHKRKKILKKGPLLRILRKFFVALLRNPCALLRNLGKFVEGKRNHSVLRLDTSHNVVFSVINHPVRTKKACIQFYTDNVAELTQNRFSLIQK